MIRKIQLNMLMLWVVFLNWAWKPGTGWGEGG